MDCECGFLTDKSATNYIHPELGHGRYHIDIDLGWLHYVVAESHRPGFGATLDNFA